MTENNWPTHITEDGNMIPWTPIDFDPVRSHYPRLHSQTNDSENMYRLLGCALNYIECMRGAGCINYVGGHSNKPINGLDFSYWDCYCSGRIEQGYVDVMDWIASNID